MEFLTREFFDTLIFVVIGIGMVLAGIRLYQDFTRPLPDNKYRRFYEQETTLDTQETPVVRGDKPDTL